MNHVDAKKLAILNNRAKTHEFLRNGLTTSEIAAKLGVHITTVRDYIRKGDVVPDAKSQPDALSLGGRPTMIQSKSNKERAIEMRNAGIDVREIAEQLKVSRVSVYKYLENKDTITSTYTSNNPAFELKLLHIKLDAVTKERDLYRQMLLSDGKCV